MGPLSDFGSRKVEHPVDKSSAYNLPLTWIYAGTGFCGKAGIVPPQPIKKSQKSKGFRASRLADLQAGKGANLGGPTVPEGIEKATQRGLKRLHYTAKLKNFLLWRQFARWRPCGTHLISGVYQNQ